MRVTFAGGVGEHGRNCFLVEAVCGAFLVDCGIMAGSSAPYPHLNREQIRLLRYVFLTHSHGDHAGALAWLAEQGFRGRVVAAAATLEQTGRLPMQAEPLEQFLPPEGMELQWGRAGHCAGSVWYEFKLADKPPKRLLFSGDYTEHSLVYAVDPIRDSAAGLAVLDSAYGAEPRGDDAMRQDFLDAVCPYVDAGRPVLFPVPRYGRGQEMLCLLSGKWPEIPVYGDTHFQKQVAALSRDHRWVRPQARDFLQKLEVHPLEERLPRTGFCFLSGPQLRSAKAAALAGAFAGAGGVILTGAVERNSGAARLMAEHKAEFCRIPVHCTDAARRALQNENHFARVVPYHTAAWPCAQKTMEI